LSLSFGLVQLLSFWKKLVTSMKMKDSMHCNKNHNIWGGNVVSYGIFEAFLASITGHEVFHWCGRLKGKNHNYSTTAKLQICATVAKNSLLASIKVITNNRWIFTLINIFRALLRAKQYLNASKRRSRKRKRLTTWLLVERRWNWSLVLC